MEFSFGDKGKGGSSSTQAPAQTQTVLVPWVEKYRPTRLDDISHQDEVVDALKRTVETGALPHLLFHGPAGTGKTTTILALARELFGADLYKSRVFEMNASDNRRISDVQEKVKGFAQSSVRHAVGGRSVPPFKIIILDEADNMTSASQTALRRIIEAHSRTTRFCLICNYVSRIIEPLTSRCAKFRFKPLPSPAITARLMKVAESESVALDKATAEVLVSSSGGDLRKAITYLQSSARLFGVPTPDGIRELAGELPPSVVNGLVETARAGSFDALRAYVEKAVASGFAATQVLLQLHQWVVVSDSLTDVQKSRISLVIAGADRCLADGADETLQLLNVATALQQNV